MPLIVHAAPHASAATPTLDIPETQALEGYPADRFPYHHRILLIRVSEGVWIVATPTLDVFQTDLRNEDVVPLGRNSSFPLDVRPIFAFEVLTIEQLASIRSRGAALANILGATIPAAVSSSDAFWLYADPSLELFNVPVPIAIVNTPDATIMREAVGLVKTSLDGATLWTTMERVSAAEREDWVFEKRSGPGRDPRLGPLGEAADGLLPLFRETIEKKSSTLALHTTFRGPRAVAEVESAFVSSGSEPPTYSGSWLANSGVNPKSALAIEHTVLVWCLWFMAVVDRLSLRNLTSAEHISRRLLQIEKAVAKSPKSPDFEGLDAYAEHFSHGASSVATPAFDQHVADTQRVRATIQKQSRLAREEADAEAKRGNAPRDKQKDPKKDHKGKDKDKDKDKDKKEAT